jgi:hypothetical protein
MSITAVVWLGLAALLAVASLFRPPFGFSLYLLTFYLFPSFWWWGKALPDLRWNMSAGLVFLVAVLLHSRMEAQPDPATRRVGNIAVAILANATLVHLLLAPDLEVSLDNYIRVVKFVLLFFLIVNSVRNPRDLRLVLWSVVLGASYLGFEATVNDRGRMVNGRLEGIGAAGVANANELASLMVTILPLAGGLFFSGTRAEKLLVAITGPLILNVILLCSSRGAFLALIGGAVTFLVSTTGPVRKKAFAGLGLAALATFLLIGDVRIVERFSSVFTSAEERDTSATSRLVYWKAGFRMLLSHPLGAGGDGYKNAYASEFLAGVGIDAGARSVHNGILNEACEWGVQGFALRMLFLGLAAVLARRTLRHQTAMGNAGEAALGCCLLASMAAFVGSSMFGDYMDDEWGYWIPALIVTYTRLYGVASLSGVVASPAPALRTGAATNLPKPAVADAALNNS